VKKKKKSGYFPKVRRRYTSGGGSSKKKIFSLSFSQIDLTNRKNESELAETFPK
jgi:hypothetical protein